MRNKFLLLVVSSVVAMPAWTAETDTASKQENIGVGSGAAIGAIAGGPVGLIVGAAFGAWLGDRFHHERSERLAFEAKYGEAQADAASLESRLSGTERQARHFESELLAERLAHREDLRRALDIEVMFRTGDSELADDIEPRLARLAELVSPIDGTMIRLEGHADARGSEEYNEQLSAARAAAVRDALIEAGMPAARITMSAIGERDSTAQEKDLDAMAFERRVQIKLVDQSDDINRVAQQ
jgi:outer membrane protein OmpA-like peptidoglycan-associated protein